jgi:hypothetical protein
MPMPSLAQPLSAKLALELPDLSARLYRFASPVKRVRSDFGEAPTGLRAVGTSADLDDVLAAPPANLRLEVVARRIRPRDAPRLNRRVPRSKRRAIHIHGRIDGASPRRPRRHDPDVLHGTSFKHPPEVSLALDLQRRDVAPPIVEDLKFPAADQPAVDVRLFGNLQRATGRCQLRVKRRGFSESLTHVFASKRHWR